MKGVLLALSLALSLCVGAQAQPVGPAPFYCNKVQVNSLTVGTTQLIIGVANQVITICGYLWDENANGTAQIVFGTGASCTSSTPISTNTTTSVGGHVVNRIATGYISSAPGQSVCAIVTGSNPLNTEVYYFQQ